MKNKITFAVLADCAIAVCLVVASTFLQIFVKVLDRMRGVQLYLYKNAFKSGFYWLLMCM